MTLPVLQGAYADHGYPSCSLSVVWDILSEMIRFVPATAVILFDVLDECSDPPSTIKKIAALNSRVIIISRPEPSIIKSFQRVGHLFSIKMAVAADISKFVTEELREDARLRRHVDTIIEKVTGAPEQADGHFFYARLVINELREGPSHHTISEAIVSLPLLVNEMNALLTKRLPPRLAPVRRTVLTMMSVAFRPFRVKEVAYAHAALLAEKFDPGPDGSVIISEDTIVQSCGF